MLPLSYPGRWKIAGAMLLICVLAVATAPAIWPWSGGHLTDWFQLSDKWLHGITFASLALWYSGQYARRSYGWLAFSLLMFGVMIEACQSMLTYRTAEVGDIFADGLGIAAGLSIALLGVGGWSLRAEGWLRK